MSGSTIRPVNSLRPFDILTKMCSHQPVVSCWTAAASVDALKDRWFQVFHSNGLVTPETWQLPLFPTPITPEMPLRHEMSAPGETRRPREMQVYGSNVQERSGRSARGGDRCVIIVFYECPRTQSLTMRRCVKNYGIVIFNVSLPSDRFLPGGQ